MVSLSKTTNVMFNTTRDGRKSKVLSVFPFSCLWVFSFFLNFWFFAGCRDVAGWTSLDIKLKVREFIIIFFFNKMSLRIKKRSSIEVRLRNLLTKGSIETDALQKIKTSFLWLLS